MAHRTVFCALMQAASEASVTMIGWAGTRFADYLVIGAITIGGSL